MFNLQKEFEKIISKIPDFGKSLEIEKEIEKCIFNEVCALKGKKIVIRGGGVHTEELLKFIEQKHIRKNLDIIAVIDDVMQGGKINGIPIISKKQGEKLEHNQIIISSFNYRNEMLSEYDNTKVNVWNLYNSLSKRGYNLEAPFYFYKEGGYEIPLYYLNVYAKDKSKINLEFVIDSLLKLKDFKTVFYYIDKYINNGFDMQNIYKELKDELKKMFCLTKKIISNRTQKDIVMFWIDAVPYDQLYYLPFVYAKKDNSYFFENIHTVTPYTHPTIHAVLQGALRIDNYNLTKSKIDETNSEVIQDLQKSGYDFLYIGYPENPHISENFKMKKHTLVSCKKINEVSVCKVYWELLCNLLSSTNPLYCIVHSVTETHEPYMSLPLWKNHFYKLHEIFEHEQNKKSYKYLDEQLLFYSNFLSNKIIKIYMSDHGNIQKHNNWDFTEHRIHPFFLIEGEGIPIKKIKEVFSYADFKYIIKYLLSGNEEYISKAIKKYVVIEDVDKYNPKRLKPLLYNGFEEYGMAYRGVVTSSDKYVRLANGKEFYFILPDESKNLINDSRYSDRIAELSEVAGDYFLNLDDYPEFEHSKKLYIDKNQSNKKKKEEQDG